MITFKKVNKWFGELHVLNDVDFHVDSGEVVVICGPSGSGKSTLIRCINKLEPIQQGEIYVDNMPIHDPKINLRRVREEIGFVFQQFNLYPHMTVLKNITLAPIHVRKQKKEEAEAYAHMLLEKVDIAEKANSYPDQLSGGQQQRVAIARAIVNQAPIILADEPTGNLDTHTSREIMELFQRLNGESGITVILVTHEADIAAYSRRTIRFLDGRLVSDRLTADERRGSETGVGS